jgi:hypothetical protein
MNNQSPIITFTGLIPIGARRLAENLSKQLLTLEKSKQVRLNILSVSFVNYYLQLMGFETDLEASDSWNPVQKLFMDVADLEIKNLGKLECRPILEGEEFIYVPPEVQLNRIGYVGVEITQSLREAKLLGFIQKVETDLLPISQLQSLEHLLEYLEYLSGIKATALASDSLTTGKNVVKLTQWLAKIFDAGWEEIEALLGYQPAYTATSMRNTWGNCVSRGKLIDLGTQLTVQAVVLIVTLSLNLSPDVDIIVEVHPTPGKIYLPPKLQLIVLDFEGETVMEAQTRSTNENIQFQFSADVGEQFSVKLALGNFSVVEEFVI